MAVNEDQNSALGSGVLATREVLEFAGDEPVWAVPASFATFALSFHRSPLPAGSKAEV